MEAAYEYQGIRFVWDEAKARSNTAKHDVSFQLAATVFFDPFVRIENASRRQESRDAAIGFDAQNRLLYVVHDIATSDGEEAIRIISARRATSSERQRYDR